MYHGKFEMQRTMIKHVWIFNMQFTAMVKNPTSAEKKSDLQVSLIIVNTLINNLLEYTQCPFLLC